MYTYTPTSWVNDGAPAINATNLANIETGIDNAQKELDWFVNGTALTSIADADVLRVYDASASAYRKITKANFVSGLLTSALASSTYEPIKGATENYVSDAELAVLQATSGSNTGDQDLSGYALISNVLELDNTDVFTPTANYHPATKKYVDDNGGGGGEITNLDGGNSASTYTAVGLSPIDGGDSTS